MAIDGESGGFYFELPVFALVREFTSEPNEQGAVVTLRGIFTLTAPGRSSLLVLFTDRPAAEQFRDESAPDHLVFEMTTHEAFVAMLRAAKAVAEVAVFDPYKLGGSATGIRIDDLIAMHPQ